MNIQRKPTIKEFLCDLAVWRAVGVWVLVATVCLALSSTLTARL